MNLTDYTAKLELQTQEFSLGTAFEPATKVTTEYSDRTYDTIFTIYDKDNKQLAVFTQSELNKTIDVESGADEFDEGEKPLEHWIMAIIDAISYCILD